MYSKEQIIELARSLGRQQFLDTVRAGYAQYVAELEPPRLRYLANKAGVTSVYNKKADKRPVKSVEQLIPLVLAELMDEAENVWLAIEFNEPIRFNLANEPRTRTVFPTEYRQRFDRAGYNMDLVRKIPDAQLAALWEEHMKMRGTASSRSTLYRNMPRDILALQRKIIEREVNRVSP